MGFLNDFGITSTVGLFGLALLAIGGFMVFAGTGIISIEKVTVKQGRATWIVGLSMAALGLFFLYPDVSAPEETAPSVVVVEVTSTAVTEATEVVLVEPTTEAVEEAAPTAAPSELSSDGNWTTVQFSLPDDALWTEEAGRYTATGANDTFAWSEDSFTGNIEISFDIESTGSFTAANVLVYGDGESFSPNNLTFTIASDQQVIIAGSVYDGNQLEASLNELTLNDQKHTVLISIIDQKVSLFLDGEEILSTQLNDNINTSGKIGLFKYWEISDITYSNIQVRTSGFDQ